MSEQIATADTLHETLDSMNRTSDAVLSSGDDSSQMRVLHIVAGNLYGGVESYLATVARLQHLRPKLHHEFGLCFAGRLRDELIALGAIVHDLGGVRLSRPGTVRHARRRLEEVSVAGTFDAVAVHGCWPHVVFASRIKRLGVKFVHVMHDNVAAPGWLDRLASWRKPDLVLANSKFTLTGARKLFPGVPVEVCYLPVESSTCGAEVRDEVRREFNAPEDRLVILQASRLETWKGQGTLIRALDRLSDDPRWECWIAGGAQRPHEEQYLGKLKSLAAGLGIDNRIRFLGQRSDVRRLLAAADVFCQPNESPEPFGIAFIEALYAGLPVVTSDFGGGAEIITDEVGVKLLAGDADRLAEALRKLIDDRVLRSSLGNVGPTRAAELCDPRRHFDQFKRAIRHTAITGKSN